MWRHSPILGVIHRFVAWIGRFGLSLARGLLLDLALMGSKGRSEGDNGA
jgi:hypothetical protein